MRALVIWTLVMCAARAEAEGPAEKGRADQLITEGVELRRQRRDAEALERFMQARALAASPRTTAQIGFAEQALGRWLEAERELRAALAELRDPWVTKNRETIAQALVVVAEHLGELEIDGGPLGAQVRVNGAPAGVLPLGGPLRLPIGTASVEVSAPGHLAMTRTVAIATAALARETIVLIPLPVEGTATAARDLEPAPRGSPRLRIAGWTLFGVGAAMLATGIAGSVLRADHGARWSSDACVGNGLSRAENCAGELEQARLGQDLAIAGYVAGGVSLSAAIALLVKGYPRARGRR